MPYELIQDDPDSSLVKAGKESLRHGARTASNLATRAVGLPGDIFSLVNQFIAKPASKLITGEEGVPYEQTILGKVLPTTETHRKGIESISGEYLKPRNKIESFVDDVIEDTALLFNPTQKIAQGVSKAGKVVKILGKSIGANLAGETVGQISGSEGAGDLTKAGALFILSAIDQESAAKQVGKLYAKADSKLPAVDMAKGKNLEKNVDALIYKITQGRPLENLSAPEKFVINQAEKIRNIVYNGEINVKQAIAQKRSLNEELSSLWKEVPGKKDQKKVKGLAKQLNGLLQQTIADYGKKNPEFYKLYKDADQAFGTLAKSNFITHWVENNVVQHPATTGLLHLFTPISKAAAGAAVPYQGVKLLYRVSKSPTLAKIYGKTIAAAAKEDAVAFNKYLMELDKNIQEEENEDRYEFID